MDDNVSNPVNTHSHEGALGHAHGAHSHTHTKTRQVLNRLARLTGHLNSVTRMVEDGRDCSEVLTQIAAVQSALSGVAKLVLKDHIEHCLFDAARTSDFTAIEELNRAIERFL
ncbi:MAG: metal-sensing transcriptional repressor [Oscillospiraceae bacterium]|jgi:DNA-binding FrmR family transcriptional regulator|nr:metal-sensing transcriptional repressor [Oscillospiraceae bacterium]